MAGEVTFTKWLNEDESKFYSKSREYWSEVEPTINGMLGGFGCISNIDISGSDLFLKKIFIKKRKLGRKRALDCGAGIGRITKNLLIKYFECVDLVEQNPKFIEVAKKSLSLENTISKYYVSSLQNFTPEPHFYDVIWCQWVLGHLTDDHLVDFLIRCKNGLRQNGVIIVKENVTADKVLVDEIDSSVTRSYNNFLQLFEKAKLHMLKQCRQSNFPKQLMCVKLFALQPLENNN